MANPVSLSTSPDWVTEDDVRQSLEALRQQTAGYQAQDARAGLFGPGSMYWEINKHAFVYFAGAVPAVFMQLAHPWIAAAIGEHSKIMSNPRQRARMTYSFLWSIIYGDMDVVARRSLGLYRLHTRVTGNIGEDAGRHQSSDDYRANERNAMLWVHLTAVYCRVSLYEKIVRPLKPEEKDRLCLEARLYGACFGLPADMHPDNWAALERYMADMQQSDTLARTAAGLRVTRFLENAIPHPLRRPFAALNSLSVPARTREILELAPDNAVTQRQAKRMLRILKLMRLATPGRLGYVPAYNEAMGRLAGRDKPDWLTARLNKLIIGTPQLVS
ncbi:MAG: oxygenase MpaB family protein [Moraxellaceae bacterium]